MIILVECDSCLERFFIKKEGNNINYLGSECDCSSPYTTIREE